MDSEIWENGTESKRFSAGWMRIVRSYRVVELPII